MLKADAGPMSGPLRIDGIELPSGGLVGLTHCPGRTGADGAGRLWRRDLDEDFAAIERWGAAALVTLVENAEFARLGVPEFAGAARRRRFAWRHVPIPDMRPPGPEAQRIWREVGPETVGALRRGERVVFHCAAGLGRTGTMVAKLLVDAFGLSAEAAIRVVRAGRPGAIESAAQEAFVAGPPLIAGGEGPWPGAGGSSP